MAYGAIMAASFISRLLDGTGKLSETTEKIFPSVVTGTVVLWISIHSFLLVSVLLEAEVPGKVWFS